MKKLLLLLLVCVCLEFEGSAQYVNLPDSNFRNSLKRASPGCFNAAGQMDTTCQALESILYFEVLESNIRNIDGIKYLKRLEKLQLSPICQVAYLPELPSSLQYLFARSTRLLSISNLPSGLRYLDVGYSELRNIVSLPDSLVYLNANSTRISTLPGLPNSLRTLNLFDCSGLTGLNALPDSLRYLTIYNCREIRSLPALPPKLDTLECPYCQIDTLPNLPDGLLRLWYSQGSLRKLPVLPSHLKYLDCSRNPVQNAMPDLPNGLEFLNCRDNSLRNLPALPPGLKFLDCSGNWLTALPPLPDSITYLNCASNQLLSIPALPSFLDTFDFQKNKIRTFPSVPNSVRILNCSSNPISRIPGLPDSLKEFNCSFDSALTILPALPAGLKNLNCSNNKLVNLPELPAGLTILFCQSNLLGSLPELPSKLSNLSCTGNRIFCLPVLPADMTLIENSGLTREGAIVLDSNIRCIPNLPRGVRFFRQVTGGWIDVSPPPLCNPTNNRNHCASFPIMQGIVFYDNNGDGVYNTGEQVKQNVKVSLSNGSFTFTNNNGFYEVAADSLIAYTLSVPAPARFNAVPASYRYTFTSFDTLVVNNFALQPNAVVDSVAFSTTALGWAARPGFAFPVMVNYDNVGTTTLTPNITFNYDNTKLTYDSSSNAGVSNNGNSLSLSVGSFVPGQQGSFIAYFRVKPTAALGDSIKSTAVLTSNALVVNSSMSNVVRGSFDPNDKNATPQLSPSQVAAGQYIDYTIRFQNTGNDTAFNIIITDTLSNDLQAATFRMKGASHTCKTTVKGNVVYFEFLNILLADSTVNEPLSHGFVTFSIQPKATVAVNTTINNKAAIYFDYNAPIITNTAGTLIKDFAVLPLHLVSFTAVPQFNNSTALNWVTSNEVNSKYFVIEQSSDARNFAAIATVLAKGNASNQYNSLATDLNNSLVYYRLKMVDRDGTFSYSPVLKIDRRKNTAGFSVLSNPVKDALIIYTNDPQLNGSNCTIINTQGAVVKQFVLQQGNQSVDLKALASGMYYLKTNHGSSRILLQ